MEPGCVRRGGGAGGPFIWPQPLHLHCRGRVGRTACGVRQVALKSYITSRSSQLNVVPPAFILLMSRDLVEGAGVGRRSRRHSRTVTHRRRAGGRFVCDLAGYSVCKGGSVTVLRRSRRRYLYGERWALNCRPHYAPCHISIWTHLFYFVPVYLCHKMERCGGPGSRETSMATKPPDQGKTRVKDGGAAPHPEAEGTS